MCIYVCSSLNLFIYKYIYACMYIYVCSSLTHIYHFKRNLVKDFFVFIHTSREFDGVPYSTRFALAISFPLSACQAHS